MAGSSMIALICGEDSSTPVSKGQRSGGKVIIALRRLCKAALQAWHTQLFWLFACRGCWRPPIPPRIIMHHLLRVRLLLHYLHPFGSSPQIIARCLDVPTVWCVRGLSLIHISDPTRQAAIS